MPTIDMKGEWRLIKPTLNNLDQANEENNDDIVAVIHSKIPLSSLHKLILKWLKQQDVFNTKKLLNKCNAYKCSGKKIDCSCQQLSHPTKGNRYGQLVQNKAVKAAKSSNGHPINLHDQVNAPKN